MMKNLFDVVVIGAGHAGIEAALIAEKLGVKTLLITSNINTAGVMSCNPSIGGLGKGHIVKEIDMLGGVMGKITDLSAIQYKKLNRKKGPAVRGSRAQCDKWIYANEVQKLLKEKLGSNFIEAEVKKLLIEKSRVKGVVLDDGSQIFSKKVIITAGTFMRGILHIGSKCIGGGRVGEKPSIGLSDQLSALGVEVKRLKTGTPPRLKRNSIDWSTLEMEYGDKDYENFHFMNHHSFKHEVIGCGISYTNEKTHQIIYDNLKHSPLFTGALQSVGPRYCPSIEDKVTRFSDKPRHQTFLEPEGLSAESIYLQGLSTSLPEDIQLKFLQTIKGLSNVEMIRPGYAVEYDFIQPKQLNYSFETRFLEGLYLAGQVNGTSGYEEAAGQGLIAGINAVLSIRKEAPLILPRYKAYIGVLVDDLVAKGTEEPYRMLTSRAEFRLMLREDNALERLFEYSEKYSLLNKGELDYLRDLSYRRKRFSELLSKTVIVPNSKNNSILKSLATEPLKKPTPISLLLSRPEISLEGIRSMGLVPDAEEGPMVEESVQIALKYAGYIKNELTRIEKVKRLESLEIPESINYGDFSGLSNEEVEKLDLIRPKNLAQAKTIQGVNPSAIQYLAIYISKNG